jgi:RHS repeat-associated protein
MPGRKYSSANGYRYGFNGKENDKEVKGDGNQQDYGMRIYDPRLGRFLSVDPLSEEYPWNSTYAYAENDVIRAIDIEGAEKYIKTNYRNAAGIIYKTTIQSITNNQTGKAVELNFHNATGKLTTDDVYESDMYDNGKVVDIKRDKGHRNKLSSDEIKILNKQKTARSQTTAPRESDPFDNNIFYEGYVFQKGVYNSDIIDGDNHIEKVGFMKVSLPHKPKITAPKAVGKPVPITTTSSSSFGSSINFWSSTASTQGSIKSEINDIVSSVNGKSDYSITILGNFNGASSEDFNTKANILARANGYKTYGDLALARANKIKEKLVEAGLDASKIKTALGDPQGGMNADYKITTTTIK